MIHLQKYTIQQNDHCLIEEKKLLASFEVDLEFESNNSMLINPLTCHRYQEESGNICERGTYSK